MPGDPIVIEIHVHHHFDGPIEVVLGDARRRARGAVLQLKERTPMTTTSVTVDATNEIAQVVFVDDHGDTDAAAPEGAVITFTSSNPAAATVTADPADPRIGLIGVVGEGQTDIGVAVTDGATGEAYPGWEPIESVTLQVDPGAAVGARLSLATSEPTTGGGDPGTGDPGAGEPGTGDPGTGDGTGTTPTGDGTGTDTGTGDGGIQPGDGTVNPPTV